MVANNKQVGSGDGDGVGLTLRSRSLSLSLAGSLTRTKAMSHVEILGYSVYSSGAVFAGSGWHWLHCVRSRSSG